jgi:hypothetical protein
MIIRNPKTEELASILDALNIEFIFSKGKRLRIEKRFPFLFENIDHLWGLFENDELLAFLAIKPTLFKISNETIQGFFIGSVFTPNIHRKKGFAKSLLKYIQEKYILNNYKFGVLWTNLHEYYAKFGWVVHENGCYIECSNAKELHEINALGVEVTECNINDYKSIDNYRVDIEENHIIRNYNDVYYGYGSVYSPGEMPLLVKVVRDTSIIGYAVGVMNDTTIIFSEIIELNEEVMSSVLKYLFEKYNKVVRFNYNLDSNSDKINSLNHWFKDVNVTKPIITMYFCPDIKILNLIKNYYIPFLDRI